ncbi:MAG: hypothetical protein L3K26_11615, partial [Candidatus Hydrogenedentes bacterium]|nr:hypothetical protein [Candidatus Hydrogenedentota bacterium]
MGISKKLMLASLVSMMVVLAFVIGLVPSHDTASVRAAGDSDRIDFGQFLDLILMNQVGTLDDKGVGTTLGSLPYENGDTIIVPTSNTGTIDVMLSATVAGSGNDTTVTYVANDATEGGAPWAPGVYTQGSNGIASADAFPTDFATTLALESFIPNAAGAQTAVLIYALINAVADSAQPPTYMFESVNAMGEAITLTLASEDNDGDGNGFPDDPFADVAVNASSIANVVLNGADRTALLANMDASAKATLGETIVAFGNVMVTAPSTADLVAEGLIGAGDSAFLMVTIVDDLDAMVDSNLSGGTLSEWADAVVASQPLDILAGAPYVEISIVAGTSTGDLVDIDDLGTLEVNLFVSGDFPAEGVQLYSYATAASADGGQLVSGGTTSGAWALLSGDPVSVNGNININFSNLSIFAPFASAISVSSLDPNELPGGATADVTINGAFPILDGVQLTASEAAAAFSVTMNGAAATFREVGGSSANATSLYVTAPALALDTVNGEPVETSVTLVITDLVNVGNTVTVPSAATLKSTVEVTVTVDGMG